MRVCGTGYNVCIFAYGQTGSGKTHTMVGSNVTDIQGRGINYRTLDDLFAINAQRADEVRSSLTSHQLMAQSRAGKKSVLGKSTTSSCLAPVCIRQDCPSQYVPVTKVVG